MSKFALNTALPRYLRVEQERIVEPGVGQDPSSVHLEEHTGHRLTQPHRWVGAVDGDGGTAPTQTVTVHVLRPNVAPVGTDDTFDVDEDHQLVVDAARSLLARGLRAGLLQACF